MLSVNLAPTPSLGSTIWVIVVLLVILVAAYFTTRLVGGGANRLGRSRYIRPMDTAMLGKDKQVQIVEISGKIYILGITGHSITVINTLEKDELEQVSAARQGEEEAPAAGIAGWFQRMRSAPRNLEQARRETREEKSKYANIQAQKMDEVDDDDIELILRSVREKKARLEREGQRSNRS